MDYALTPGAYRDLKRFDLPTRRKIIKKVKSYLESTDPLKFAKVLTQSPYGTYRFRVGKVRVIFIHEPKEGKIVITRVRFRREAY